MSGRMPNLMIIGAMKCGTSSLHDYLSLHPDIFMSTPKEIHYFADIHFKSKSLDWYKSFFESDKKILGCSPQSYTKCHNKFYQNIPQRIYEHSPNIKMIYIVRDPLKRYTSHILESYQCDTSADIKYSQESGNYLKTGLYYKQMLAYLEYFNKEQIHILSLEDLQENKLQELNKIFRFLEIDELHDESIFNFITNDADSKPFPRIIRKNIFYRIGNKVIPRLTNSIAKFIANKYFAHQLKKPVLSLEEENTIKEQMKDDIAKFREFTGNSFSNWSV